jgi:hypothetical protein
MRAYTALFVAVLYTTSLCPAQTAPAKHTLPKHESPEAASPAVAPEMIFFNGIIYTGAGMAEDTPETVEAMAVGRGKVLAAGTTEAIKRLAGPETRLVDLNTAKTGTFIFPGFNDAHTHLGNAGRTKLNVDLTGVRSLGEMLAKVETFAKDAPKGHWLIGGNWDHTLWAEKTAVMLQVMDWLTNGNWDHTRWAEKTLPTRQDLDRVTGGHPAFLKRIDGHIAVANSAALAAAGITGKTRPPQGGAIDLDAKGEPTGILRESAQELVYKVIPPPSEEERRKGDELAIADALAHGVTSVQDFSDWEDFLVFEELEKKGNLHLRISEWLPFKESLEELEKMRAHHDANDPMLHTGMLKGFLDGSLGSRTAAMKKPFADDPGNTGLPQYDQEQLNEMAVERAQADFQLGFHAIGDKAVAMALEALSRADQADHNPFCRSPNQQPRIWDEKTPCPEKRHRGRDRIEHAQVVDEAEIMDFRMLGAIASMQPSHLLTDMNWAEDRLGPKRAAYSYAWKAFLDAGVPLAFGTDYPVEPITPFRGLYAAVTRMNERGTKTYFPENKLTRGQAIYAYTQGSAYAEFQEKHKGKLAPGYDADFILVDRDLYKVDAAAMLRTNVLETFVGGREAFSGNTAAR